MNQSNTGTRIFTEHKPLPLDGENIESLEQAAKFIEKHCEEITNNHQTITIHFNNPESQVIFDNWATDNQDDAAELGYKFFNAIRKIRDDGWAFYSHKTTTTETIRGSDFNKLVFGFHPDGATLSEKSYRESILFEIKEYLKLYE